MKHNSKATKKWQTIKPRPAHGRNTFVVTFNDPRITQPKSKRVQRGLGTNDRDVAQRICHDLECIVNTADFWNIKHPAIPGFHPKSVEIFFDEAPPKQVVAIPVQDNYVQPFNEHEIGYRFNELEYRAVMPNELQSVIAKYEKDLLEERRQKNDAIEEAVGLRREAGRDVKVTLSEAFEEWKLKWLSKLNPTTFRDASRKVGWFVQSVGGAKLIGTVRAGDVMQWVSGYTNHKKKQKGNEVSPVTLRKVRAYVKQFLNWTYQIYGLREKVTDRLGAIPGLSRNPEKIEAIHDPEHLKTLLKALDPWPYWKAWVGVAILAGPRFAEQCWLKIGDVDFKNGYIRVTSRTSGKKITGTKTGKERKIPIERTTLKDILENHIAAHDREYEWLFPSTLGEGTIARKKSLPGQWSGSKAFHSTYAPILKTAKESVKGTEDFWDFGPKQWRHCFGTALGHSGLSSLLISQLMGNSATVAERHYIAPLDVAKHWPFKWKADA